MEEDRSRQRVVKGHEASAAPLTGRRRLGLRPPSTTFQVVPLPAPGEDPRDSTHAAF